MTESIPMPMEMKSIGFPPPEPVLGDEGTDFDAISKNRVSITPLKTDFTDFKSMEALKDWL